MRDVVVGFDGSSPSRSALQWACRLAERRVQPLRVIRVWQYPASAGIPGGPAVLPPPVEMDRAALADLLAELVADFGEDRARGFTVEVARGSPAGVLVQRANEEQAESIVVGARGLGGFRRLLLGSTSRQCLEYALCPVVVVRTGEGATEDLPSRLVVGVDGSAGAAQAVRWAAGLAADLDAEVIAVHGLGVWSPHESFVARMHDRLAGEWTEPLRAAGVRHSAVVDEREARDALPALAEERDAGLIVVGARGAGPVQAVLLGSTAQYLASRATRPLAVVPQPERRR